MGIRVTFIVLFILVSALPTMLMPFYENKQTTENRAMAVRPVFSIKDLWTFSDQWQLYYADHFALRDYFSQDYIDFKINILKSDPLPDKVRKGKDDWYFLGNSSEHVFDAAIGAEKIDVQQIDYACRAIAEMKAFCDSLHIGLYMIVPPDKHTVYHEYLPVPPNRNIPRKLDLLKRRLTVVLPDFELIDLRAEFGVMKDSIQLYHKTDSHWNHAGAFYATQKLLDKIRERYPVRKLLMEDYTIEERQVMQMDETMMLGIQVAEPYREWMPKPGMVPEVRLEKTEYTLRTYNRTSDLKAVVFRDSYFKAMLGFFATSVGEALYIWDTRFNKELILQERPDFVLVEVVERRVNLLDI